MNVIVLQRQTLSDIALEIYGDISGLPGIARANGLAMTADLQAGQTLICPDVVYDAYLQNYVRKNGIKPATAYDGKFILLFYKRVGNRLCGTAIPEECNFFASRIHAVFFEISHATVWVRGRSAKRSADNPVFPVERVHATCKGADGRKFIDKARRTICVKEFRLVGNGDVCAMELHSLKAFNSLGKIFRFGGVGEISRVDAESTKKGVVHGGRFAMCNRMPEYAKSFRLSVNGSQSNLVCPSHLWGKTLNKYRNKDIIFLVISYELLVVS